MTQKSNDRISPANIIALIGIAGIGVISGIGALLNTADGNPIWPIIWTIITLVVFGGLLMLALKAKAEDSHRELWTYVMWGAISIYIIAAILMCNPFMKFFYIVSEKDNLQAQAKSEIANIESLFNRYEEQRKTFLSNAVTQFTAYKMNGSNGNQELQTYYRERVGSDVRTWMEDIALPATNINNLKMEEEWSNIKTGINQWNYLKLTQVSIELNRLQEQTWKNLNKTILEFGEEQALIPVVSGGQGTQYRLDGIAKFDLGEVPVSKFAEQIKQDKDIITATGLIAYILLNILVLFNILVAPSSYTVGPRKNGDVGGPIGTKI